MIHVLAVTVVYVMYVCVIFIFSLPVGAQAGAGGGFSCDSAFTAVCACH